MSYMNSKNALYKLLYIVSNPTFVLITDFYYKILKVYFFTSFYLKATTFITKSVKKLFITTIGHENVNKNHIG